MSEVAWASYPLRGDEYAQRMPDLPRIQIPPLPLNGEGKPNIVIEPRTRPPFSFLEAVDLADVVHQNAALEWSYESRHNSQAILPFLFLGPITAAKDESWLSSQKITMVLGTSHAKSKKVEEIALKLGIKYFTIQAPSNQALVRNFSRATDLINSHVQATFAHSRGQTFGKVLVFCETGNDRSASVVAAYLMETCRFESKMMHGKEMGPLVGAIQLCQAQRFCVSFDDYTKHLLRGHLDKLEAEWDVELCGGEQSHKKRNLERDDDEMETGDSNDDEDRFADRSYSAPFMDSPLHSASDHARIDAKMQYLIDMSASPT